MITTVGQLAVNAALPPEMRDWTRVLDGPGVQALFQRIAEHKPDKYREIAKKLSDIGRDAAYTTGGFSFGLSHLSSVDEAKQFRQKMNTYIDQVMDTPGLPDDEKQRRILDFATKESANLEKVIMDKSWAEKNPLALQIKSKARGNPTNLRSLRGADVLYVDNRDRTIPVPITRSYSEGLSPAEYWAGTYGARKGVFDTKRATADAGFFSKQLNQAAHRLVVTAEDNDEEDPDDEFIGLPVDLDDNDSVGGLLAHGVGGYPRNTLITPKILQDLRGKGVKRILARSPIAGRGPRAGGVFARDVGHREFGRLPNRGDMVGLTASQALSEKLTQGQLCLAAGTLVRMADGTVKRIEDIRVGDMVMGADRFGMCEPVRVLNVFDNGVKFCNDWQFKNCEDWDDRAVVTCTADHKILGVKLYHEGYEITRGLHPAGFMRCDVSYGFITTPTRVRGYKTTHGEPYPHGPRYEYIRAVAYRELPTWDLEVDNPDHLFVLANGIIVSNSSKHSGGVAGAGQAVSGFKFINSLVQVPKTFRGGATHAQLDGRISAVIPAPQGGHYVEVAGQRHYVGPEFKVTVKPGQDIEAGDVLSEGTPNPLEIAQHKHIGEGRRYFINAFRQAYKNSGMSGHRRNIELLSRGIIDHVQMTDELDSYNPDDIVPYSEIVRNWNPRQDSRRAPLSQSVGKYLEKPTLHHSIGTKIRPSMIPEFEEFGVKELTVHDQPPPFKPTMVRAMGAMNHDPDFMTRFLGSNLQKSMLDAVHHGGKSDLLGTSFVPSLVEGRSFGRPELATRPKLF